VKGWEVVSEEVAREKVSQCLRDVVAVMTKLGEQGEEQRELTSETLLSGIELDEAKAFVYASSGLPELDGGSSSSAPVLKRSRSYPNSDPEADRQPCLKRPRPYASLSELGKETFGADSYRNTTFSALPSHQIPLGELPHYSYAVNKALNRPSDEEYDFVSQAILRADQLKNDDSAFHRIIDRMMLEEQPRVIAV
jgi:hypothetical protein